ncbi:MAG: hypothetical protein ABH986_02570 [archaeon]
MKKTAIIFLLFFIATAYSASIEKNSINIIVDSTANSLIEETFFVSFSDQNELNLFKEKIKESISIQALKDFNLDIAPRLEDTEAIIFFEEQAEGNRVKLNYSSKSLFLVKDRIKFNEFTLNEKKFSFLVSGTKIVFPENFSLRFVLPKESQVNTGMIPETPVFSKTVEWKGPLSSDRLLLVYSIQKTPEPVTIKQTSIGIETQEDGFGVVSEKYFFEFRSQDELDYFVTTAQKNGSSLQIWSSFDSRIFPHIMENELDIKKASVEFVQNGLENSYLRIVYENESPVFIEKQQKTGRFVEWSFNSRKLNNFLSGGLIIIPENTLIEIMLPSNAEIKESNFEAKNGAISLQGYKSTSKINIVYAVKENIAPTFNLSSAIQGIISDKQSASILLVLVAAVSALIYFKKETVTEKIDDFIVKNSKVEESEKNEIEITD